MPYIGKSPSVGLRTRYNYTATAGQTSFSGADNNNVTLTYTDTNYSDVYLNGTLLLAVTDYASTTGTSIVLTSGASLNDVLEVVVYDIFSVADTVSATDGGTFKGNVNFTGVLTANGGAVFNEGGADVDFRVESDADANAFFLQGSDGNVGIGTSSPGANLDFGVTSNNSHVINLRKNSNSISSIGINAEYGVRIAGPSDSDAPVSFGEIAVSDGSTFNERMRITSDGRGLSQFTAKAWVNFNGTGTVAIRDSHNVSSITDHGTGDYSINFSNNLANVNYAPVGNNSSQEANGSSLMPSELAVDSLRVNSRNASGTLLDGSKLHFLVFGD